MRHLNISAVYEPLKSVLIIVSVLPMLRFRFCGREGRMIGALATIEQVCD